ncbi:MAG: exosortase/archaeosortase family protein [bacterium]
MKSARSNPGPWPVGRPVDPVATVFLILIAGWLLALFHWYGNTTDVRLFSPSVFRWMVMRWSDSTFTMGEYSHGGLIPLVSGWALWIKRKEISSAPKETFWPAAALVAFGLVLHWIGARAQQPRLSLAAFVVILWAIPCFLYGRGVGHLLLFPCGYLVFCIPMNFFDSFSFQLRILATAISTGMLNGVGIAVIQSGSAIRAVNGAFALEVADPCSGIRSLLAMTALTAAFAFFIRGGILKKLILFASAIPLAIAGNIVRVMSIACVARFAGQEKAMDYYHDYSGYVIFAVAVILMLALEKMLSGGDQTGCSSP